MSNIRIFVKAITPPLWFDVPFPEGAKFQHVANEILLNGFSSPHGCIAGDNIAGVFLVPEDPTQDMKNRGIVISNAPDKKQ